MTAPFTMASAIGPSLLLLWYFHSRDTFPEPAALLWRTFAMGALAIISVCAVALPVMAVVDRSGAPPLLLGTLQAFLGAAASLGFATLENVLYCAEGGPVLAALLLFGLLPAGLGFASFAGGVRLVNRPR